MSEDVVEVRDLFIAYLANVVPVPPRAPRVCTNLLLVAVPGAGFPVGGACDRPEGHVAIAAWEDSYGVSLLVDIDREVSHDEDGRFRSRR